MFEKLPSLKDFIIYLIPGLLICYFGLNIFYFYFKMGIETADVSKNAALSLIGIVFSFLVGFLISQIQIIIVNKLFQKKFRKLRTIKKTFEKELAKETLITRVIDVFKLGTVNRSSVEEDNLIIFSCLTLIKVKGSPETNFFLDRNSNLSSFASASMIPILLGSFNLLLQFELTNCSRLLLIITECILLIFILRKIILNYRDEWFKTIFRQFLIITNYP